MIMAVGAPGAFTIAPHPGNSFRNTFIFVERLQLSPFPCYIVGGKKGYSGVNIHSMASGVLSFQELYSWLFQPNAEL